LLTSYQQSVAAYWDATADPALDRDQVNRRLGDVDGLYHHHYGIGAVDPDVWDAPERVTAELHRLETAQADLLLNQLGPLTPADRVLDAGCGRGGTSLMAHARFGCAVDGVTISQYQAEFAAEQAAVRQWDQVRFHHRDMLDTGFPDGAFQAVWTNETTMYVHLPELVGEFRRLLAPGGRYVCVTGAYNDTLGGKSAAVAAIDSRYSCCVHPRSGYFAALANGGFSLVTVADLTPDTIPYWELRARSPLATGVEEDFLTAYRDGSFHYLLIVADRLP
jgi:geranyl diphosphate 2-C-methyltransferase